MVSDRLAHDLGLRYAMVAGSAFLRWITKRNEFTGVVATSDIP